MNILIIDSTKPRATLLGRQLKGVSGTEVHVLTRKRGRRLCLRIADDGAEEDLNDGGNHNDYRLILQHYRDDTTKWPLDTDGVRIWFGAGGSEPQRGGAWHIHGVVKVTTIKHWLDEWFSELVAWAAMGSAERESAPVPQLLSPPPPDAILALHLLALLGEQPEDIALAAKQEAVQIAGRGEGDILDVLNAEQRTEFIRKWCS